MPHLLTALLFLALIPQLCQGHARGEDYVFTNFREKSIDGFFEMNHFDLQKKFQIDIASEGVDALAVLTENEALIHDYIRSNFRMGPDKSSSYPITFLETEHRPPPAIASGMFPFTIDTGPQPDQVHIWHDMFYDIDPLHRGILVVSYNHKTQRNYGEEHVALAFTPTSKEQILALTDIPSIPVLTDAPRFGFYHILIHQEHLLHSCLLALAFTTLFFAKDPLSTKQRWSLLLALAVLVPLLFALCHCFSFRLFRKIDFPLSSQLLQLLSSLILFGVGFVFFKFSHKLTPKILLLFLSGCSGALGLLHGLDISGSFGSLSIRLVQLKSLAFEFSKGCLLYTSPSPRDRG